MLRTLFAHTSNKFLKTAGFTMIELLVVISVIGVLSVAVLSSINPIEQINKGRDTRTRNDAAQLINAIDRYFSIQEEYPWNRANITNNFVPTVTDYVDEFVFSETDGILDNSSSDWGWVQILSDNAEVKSGFVNRLTNDPSVDYVLIKDAGANSTMYACFVPSSNAFEQEAMTRCDENSESSDSPISEYSPYYTQLCACINDADGDCYVCLP